MIRGYYIVLNFTTLDIHHNRNFVTIYDGPSVESSLLSNISDTTKMTPMITSTSNIVLVYYKTDALKVYKGFLASYKG